MRRYELDALIATSPANVTYLSDYHCWLDSLTKEYMFVPGASSKRAFQTFAVAPLGGEPALVLPSIFAVNARDVWVDDLYLFGDAGFDDDSVGDLGLGDEQLASALRERLWPSSVDALVEALRDRGLANARLGLEEEGLAAGVRASLFRRLPGAELRDCTNLIRLIRCVKTEDEVGRLRRSAEIAEEAARSALAEARPGSDVAAITQRFRQCVAEREADVDHFAFGLRGLGIAMLSRYMLRDDDVMYVDYGCVCSHCFADSGVTLALRDPSRMLLAKYEAIRECVAVGAENLHAGRRTSAVWRAMRTALDGNRGIVSSPQGHGLGLEVREYPIVVPDSGLRIRDDCVDEAADLELEAGMVVNLEASTFIPGMASLHVERSFVIADDGSVPLITQERDRPLLPVP